MPRRPTFLHSHAAGCLALCLATLHSSHAASAPGELTAFIEKHCTDCHGSDVNKAGLRFDKLDWNLSDPANSAKWIKVLERVEAGEMPPKKKTRPDANEQSAFLTALEKPLLTAELRRQHQEGRRVLRRLNREEYQNTVRDLFGIEVDVKDLLPEDTSSHGFDNIGEALSTSSVLLERYLEAADVVLDAALPTGKRPVTKTRRYTMVPNNIRTPEKNEGKWDYRLASGVRVLPDDTYIFFNERSQPIRLEKFQAPAEGRYRFRISLYAAQSKGQSLPVAWYGGSFDPRNINTHLIDMFDAPPDKPTVIEFVEKLPLRGSIKPMFPDLGQHSLNTPELVAAYQGPGVAIQWVEVEGPLFDAWPPTGAEHMFAGVKTELGQGTREDADHALHWLATRAFRRHVTEEDLKPYEEIVYHFLDQPKSTFLAAMRSAAKAILCSPDFLFMKETAPPSVESGGSQLDDYALASRLSYFLWSSLPDEALFASAEHGQLHNPQELHAQVERMLKDPKAERFVTNFTGQWLGLRNIDFTTPDQKLYPEHDAALQDAMLKESRLFFKELLENDLSVRNLIDSNFTMLNARLAKHYGIPGVEGQQFRKVTLPPDSHRGGVLTQAAILKVTANGTTTSPVIRGNWVLRNILGKTVPPPPPNIPAIEPDIRGATTIREQVAKHRALESCAVCHDKMDPIGLALENYDVIGAWRENYRIARTTHDKKTNTDRVIGFQKGPAVDSFGATVEGKHFQNIDELKKILLADPTAIAGCVAEKLLTYATGAPATFADRVDLRQAIRASAAKDFGLRSLIHATVSTEAFRER